MMDKHTEELINLFLLDEASEAQAQELLELCRKDPSLLKELTALTEAERLLRYHDKDNDGSLFKLEVVNRLKEDTHAYNIQRSVLDQLEREQKRPLQPMSSFWKVAAVFIAVISLVLYSMTWSQRDLVLVTNSISLPHNVGEALPQGRVTFDKGILALELKNKVSLIIEGPADFEILSTEKMKLHKGKLTSDVPPGAEGFTVITPETKLIDLGTVFAVNVSQSGQTDLHVLKGEVQWEKNKASGKLIEQQALRFHKDKQNEELEADDTLFVTQLPKQLNKNQEHHHWSFDNIKNNIAEDHYTGPKEKWDGVLSRFDEQSEYPQIVNGQFGDALYLNGTSAWVQTEWPGIGGSHARTVSFWVKVPKDFNMQQGFGMVCWGSYRTPGDTWQISANPNEKEGPLGCLRIGTWGGQVVGSTDLRDNRWHHVSVVLYGDEKADTSTHILMYVDGQLEQTTRKSVRITTDISSHRSIKVMFGRNAGSIGLARNKGKRMFFRGFIDEVHITNTALSQKQIISLMNNNTLPK